MRILTVASPTMCGQLAALCCRRKLQKLCPPLAGVVIEDLKRYESDAGHLQSGRIAHLECLFRESPMQVQYAFHREHPYPSRPQFAQTSTHLKSSPPTPAESG